MKNNWSKFIYFILLSPVALFAKTVKGANLKDAFNISGEVAGNSYETNRNIYLVLGDIIAVILSLIGAVFTIFIIYAGYLWLTAAGNEQKVDKAKSILKQSIIGLVVILGAYAISYFMIQIFNSQLKTQ